MRKTVPVSQLAMFYVDRQRFEREKNRKIDTAATRHGEREHEKFGRSSLFSRIFVCGVIAWLAYLLFTWL